MDGKIELGDKVECPITGIEGIAVCVTKWMYGCVRVGVQQRAEKGKPPDGIYYADEPQLKLIKKAVAATPTPEKPEKPKHGPRQDEKRRTNPTSR